MVKASFFLLSPPFMCHVDRNLLWNDCFVNRYIIVHYRLPPKEFTPRNFPELYQ